MLHLANGEPERSPRRMGSLSVSGERDGRRGIEEKRKGRGVCVYIYICVYIHMYVRSNLRPLVFSFLEVIINIPGLE